MGDTSKKRVQTQFQGPTSTSSPSPKVQGKEELFFFVIFFVILLKVVIRFRLEFLSFFYFRIPPVM